MASVITQLKDALRQYCLAPDKIPVSLKDLGYAVEQLYNLEVKTKKVDAITTFTWGAIQFYPDRVEIYISQLLNESLARFVFAKELGQLILKDAQNVTDDPVALVSGLIQEQRLRGTARARPDVVSEQIAIIVAVELLFPFELRATSRQRICTGDVTLQEEAKRFDIPEHIVELAISDDYGAITMHLWGLPKAAE
ncbi:MAG: hypothetical protein ACLPX9_14040 [Rhodomicrobium sp.]